MLPNAQVFCTYLPSLGFGKTTERECHSEVAANPLSDFLTTRGDEQLRSHLAPLIYFVHGKLVVNYQKRPLRGSKQEPRDRRLAPLSREQEAALAIIDHVTAENAISLKQEPGDMHFFNNLALLHARSAFRDGPEKAVQRHLTRLIFRNSELGWEIPDLMLSDWAKYYDHQREIETFPEKPHPWAFSLSGHD